MQFARTSQRRLPFKGLLVRKRIFATETLRMPGFSRDAYNRRIADELIDPYLPIEQVGKMMNDK